MRHQAYNLPAMNPPNLLTRLAPAYQVPLKRLNTFGIDAIALAYLEITNVEQLRELRNHPVLSRLKRLILGGGSNVIFADQIDSLVLRIASTGKAIVDEDEHFMYVRAAAGENWHEFVLWTIAQGFGGLENLSLIPGTVGAAPIQNIGAYGTELQSNFFHLRAFDFVSGEVIRLDKAACQFAYRDSVFKRELKDRLVILDVTFALPKKWQANLSYADVAQRAQALETSTLTPKDVSNIIISIRQSKLPDPAVIGNAGSFFKNPVVEAAQREQLLQAYPNLVSYPQADGNYKLAAGWLIEQCEWKGKQLGKVGVYEKQALVLVNHGGASGAEVRALAERVQADVLEKFAVSLEVEPVFVG